MHRTVIPLGVQSPERSSSLPAARCLATSLRDGTSLAAYLALLRLGFTEPSTLPPMRWALTPPFHPYPRDTEVPTGAVCFLLHYPSREARAARAQALPGSLPCGARTFLGNTSTLALSRPSGRRPPAGNIGRTPQACAKGEHQTLAARARSTLRTDSNVTVCSNVAVIQ